MTIYPQATGILMSANLGTCMVSYLYPNPITAAAAKAVQTTTLTIAKSPMLGLATLEAGSLVAWDMGQRFSATNTMYNIFYDVAKIVQDTAKILSYKVISQFRNDDKLITDGKILMQDKPI